MSIFSLLVLEVALIAVGAVVDGWFALALSGLALFTLTAAWGLSPGRNRHHLRHHGDHRHA